VNPSLNLVLEKWLFVKGEMPSLSVIDQLLKLFVAALAEFTGLV
jgi:hypothetical protein